MAVESAGPYASLHLAPDNHASTAPLSFLQAGYPSLPPNQQRQSTEGTFLFITYFWSPSQLPFIIVFFGYAINSILSIIHLTMSSLTQSGFSVISCRVSFFEDEWEMQISPKVLDVTAGEFHVSLFGCWYGHRAIWMTLCCVMNC